MLKLQRISVLYVKTSRCNLKHIIFTLLNYFLFFIFCQAQPLIIEQYNRASGLPSDYVFDIFQDKQGYIWFATDNGVCRYDGQEYLRYSINDGLSANLVYNIYQDSKGIMWFATYEGGVSAFDGKIFRSYMPKDGQLNNTVMSVTEDRYGNMYFNGSYGLSIKQKNGWKNIKNENNIGAQNRMHTDERGNIMLSLHGKIQYLHVLSADSFRLEIISKEPTKAYDQYYTAGSRSYWVRSVNGLQSVQRIGNEIQRRTISHDWLAGLTVLPDSSVMACANLGGTLKKYDPKGHLVQIWQTDNVFAAITSDYEGNIWLGTFGRGAYKIASTRLKYQSPVNLRVPIQSIFEDKEHRLWIGTQRNFYVMSDTTVLFKNPKNDYFHVRAFAQNAEGNYYFGTLDRIVGKATYEQLKKDTILPNSSRSDGVSAMITLPNGHLAVGTYGGGLVIKDKEGKDSIIGRKQGLVSNMIENIVLDASGNIWALSNSDGLSRISPDGHVKSFNKNNNGLPSDNITALYQTTNGRIWIGTDKGLVVMDKSLKITSVPMQEWLSKDVKIVSIFEDDSRNLYCISAAGRLYKWESGIMKKAGSLPLLTSSTMSINRCYYQKRTNCLYLGTSEGLLMFDIKDFELSTIAPRVEIQRLTADETVYEYTGQVIELAYFQKNISITFAALSYTDESQVRYRYILHSGNQFSADTAYTRNRNIEFRALPHGEYSLQVEAISPDGVFSKEKALLTFIILPPFWATWWFRLLIFCILVIGITAIARYYSNRKLKKQLATLELQHRLQTERERISRDLHDSVGSQLTYIISSLDLSNRRPDDVIAPEEKRRLTSLAEFARQTMGNLREAIWILQKESTNLDDFSNKMQQFVQRQIETQPQLKAEFSFKIDSKKKLEPVQALHLFRIGQEAVNNVVKHAQATLVQVSLEIEGETLKLTVADNGKGLPENKRAEGYGLKNMQQRAKELNGQWTVKSNEPKGMILQVIVPISL